MILSEVEIFILLIIYLLIFFFYRADIIETQLSSQTGFLATDAEEYAAIIANIIEMDQDTKDIIRNAARASVDRFSGQQFESEFIRIIKPLVHTK